MANLGALLGKLADAGVRVAIEGGTVVAGPRDRISKELMREVLVAAPELLAFLSGRVREDDRKSIAAPTLSNMITRAAILMLCDGRARGGWRIVIASDAGDNVEVTEAPPGQFVPTREGQRVEVIYPSALLSGA